MFAAGEVQADHPQPDGVAGRGGDGPHTGGAGRGGVRVAGARLQCGTAQYSSVETTDQPAGLAVQLPPARRQLHRVDCAEPDRQTPAVVDGDVQAGPVAEQCAVQ